MQNKGAQRLFNGKVYFLFDWCASKSEAEAEAKALRQDTARWFVRVIKAGSGYHIWRR
jgi:hypothetical protein